MQIDEQGWLTTAKKKPSPNSDARPNHCEIDLLVIHNISLPPMDYGSDAVIDFFQNRLDPAAHPYFAEIASLQVSSHLFIRRNGDVVQFVPFSQRAWHAGKSCFEGQSACNNYSIGIELEGCDQQPYEDAQYESLLQITECLHKRYPAITANRITGHEHIAPGRKTDPGPAFDWHRYLGAITFKPSAVVLPAVQDTLDK